MINQEDREALVRSLLSAAQRMEREDILSLADALHELIRARSAAVDRYSVMQAGAEWRVVGPRRPMGHFADRAQALAVGARLAREARQAGHTVELMVQSPDGGLVPEDVERVLDAYQPGLPPQVSQPLWTEDEARAEA